MAVDSAAAPTGPSIVELFPHPSQCGCSLGCSFANFASRTQWRFRLRWQNGNGAAAHAPVTTVLDQTGLSLEDGEAHRHALRHDGGRGGEAGEAQLAAGQRQRRGGFGEGRHVGHEEHEHIHEHDHQEQEAQEAQEKAHEEEQEEQAEEKEQAAEQDEQAEQQ